MIFLSSSGLRNFCHFLLLLSFKLLTEIFAWRIVGLNLDVIVNLRLESTINIPLTIYFSFESFFLLHAIVVLVNNAHIRRNARADIVYLWLKGPLTVKFIFQHLTLQFCFFLLIHKAINLFLFSLMLSSRVCRTYNLTSHINFRLKCKFCFVLISSLSLFLQKF